MRYLTVSHFVGAIVLLVAIGDGMGEEETNSGSNMCKLGEINYRRTDITTTTVYQTLQRSTGERTCFGWDVFFGINCKIKYRLVYYLDSYTEITKQGVKVCCPGYSLVNSTCHLTGCPNNTYGENCTETCSCPDNAYTKCDSNTGNCTCHLGWHGENCSQECPEGMYGENCKQSCSCLNNATCNKMNGNCECPAGWHGDFCDEECSNNTYGVNCNRTCNCTATQQCNHVTGNCTCGPGWTDYPSCSTACPDWKYGPDCSLECSCDRNNTGNCSSTDGECLCWSGYTGENCDAECRLGTYGDGCSDDCENCTSGVCDHINGTCLCFGSQGDNCSEECEHDMFGVDCSWSCDCDSNHSNGSCNPCSGECHCDKGWTGLKCDTECPAVLDEGSCKSFALYNVCNPLTSSWKCQDGWSGEMCETVCPGGLYGQNCSQDCTCDNDKQLCNPVNGSCVCKPGRMGDNCEQVCQNNTFGIDCRFQCNCTSSRPCHHANGSCVCAHGWDGDFCTPGNMTAPPAESTGKQPDNDIVVYVSVAATGAFLAVVVFLVLAFVYNRRHNTARKDEVEMSSVKSNMTYGKTGNGHYANDDKNDTDDYIETNTTENNVSRSICPKNQYSKEPESSNTNSNKNDDVIGDSTYESGEDFDKNEDENNYADVDDTNYTTSDSLEEGAQDEHIKDKANGNDEETYDICDSLGINTKPIIDDTYNTFDDFKQTTDTEEENYDILSSSVIQDSKKKSIDGDYNTFAQVREEFRKQSIKSNNDDNRASDSYDSLGYKPEKLRFETDIYNVADTNSARENEGSLMSSQANAATANGAKNQNGNMLEVVGSDVKRISEPYYEEYVSDDTKLVDDMSSNIGNENTKLDSEFKDQDDKISNSGRKTVLESYENFELPIEKTRLDETQESQPTKALKSKERRAVDYEDFQFKF